MLYKLQISRTLLIVYVVLHIAALVAICSLVLSLTSKLFLIGLLLIYGWRDFTSRVLLNHKNSIVAFTKNDKKWFLHDKQGKIYPATFIKHSYLSAYLAVLQFRIRNKSLAITVPFDAVTTQQFKQLQLLLRYNI